MSFDWRNAAGVPILFGMGQTPRKGWLSRQRRSIWTGEGMHANPRFYKNLWQVWTETDACDQLPGESRVRWLGRWRGAPKVCTHAAMQWMKALHDNRIVFLAISHRLRRDDPALPWDFARLRARGEPLAPAYDADADPEWFGHK